MTKSSRTAIVALVAAAALPLTGAVAVAADPQPLPWDQNLAAPLTTSQCLSKVQDPFNHAWMRCYTPAQLRTAYDVNPLYAKGITGKGRTVVIVEPIGSPTVQHDLDVFDRQFGLPATHVEVDRLAGVPTFDPADLTQRAWADDTAQAVESTHAFAPGAKIVLVETPSAPTLPPSDATGMLSDVIPETAAAINHLVSTGKGDVVSIGWSALERGFPGSTLSAQRSAFTNAVAHGVTLTSGAYRGSSWSAEWPSSDPVVTAVGSTYPELDDSGQRLAPDTAIPVVDPGAGESQVFSRPDYQASVASVVGTHRGTPDVSISGDFDSGIWHYTSFAATDTGWQTGGDTTMASALFAAVVALADQAAGHRLGQLNPDLYRLYEQHSPAIIDITATHGFPNGGQAAPGYDLVTGVGTLDITQFVTALTHR